jgi:tRNA (cytidine/uridine-2'-O-)-methyltransferase
MPMRTRAEHGTSRGVHEDGKERLHMRPPSPPYRVVLVEPEIPQNTGSVSRTCVATGSVLHLVEPLGFRIDEHAVRRAGLDHWPHLRLETHASFGAFRAAHGDVRLHLFSATAKASYLDADLRPGDALVFGKESVGLAPEILAAHPERVWAIPTAPEVRSLNLSNAVAIVLFEALRQARALAP